MHVEKGFTKGPLHRLTAVPLPFQGRLFLLRLLLLSASLEKGGGPAKLVEGYFVNLFPVVSDSTEVPLSHLR